MNSSQFQQYYCNYYRRTRSGVFLVFHRCFWIQTHKKGTPYAAQVTTLNVIHTAVGQGMKRAKVAIKGTSRGRDTALWAIRRSRIRLSSVRDLTLMPHKGCRTPKRRCV